MRFLSTRRAAGLCALAVAGLLLGACSEDKPNTSDNLPDITVPSASAPSGPSAIGLLTEVKGNNVVLALPDGTKRTFIVRPEDEATVGLEHLASHAGFTDIGFQIYYKTAGGKDYITEAREVPPPQVQGPKQ
jgi:hypothetical protein